MTANSMSMIKADANMSLDNNRPQSDAQKVDIVRADGSRNRIKESREVVTFWYDTRKVTTDADRSLLDRIWNLRYTGIVLYPDNLEGLLRAVPKRMQKVVRIGNFDELAALANQPLYIEAKEKGSGELVVASPSLDVLEKVREDKVSTCYWAHVDDAKSLHAAIDFGKQHSYLLIRFRDPTNIPLELVIASLQATGTILIKEINSPDDTDDAIVTLGVMEVGADGVMFSPKEHARLDEFMRQLDRMDTRNVSIETATIVKAEPIGMGYRSCLDLTTLFTPTEGMLVGSTSQGGILCCPEVFYLPYMDLRPFRVNAGAVHSYVYNVDNRTNYMTELRAGSPVMIVGTQGQVRRAQVGRVKTEVRPLRLIEAEFKGGQRVNVIMQDDWHVRIFSDKSTPLNITELKPGDKILGHCAEPGRHVGIKVDEHIVET